MDDGKLNDYGIYAVEKRSGQGNNTLQRLLTKNRRFHAYLVLANIRQDKILSELHFVSRTKNKSYPLDLASNFYYSADYAACILGFKQSFRAISSLLGFGNKQLFLKGLERKPRDPEQKLSDRDSCLIVSGTKKSILKAWVDACHYAIHITESNLEFTPRDKYGDSLNCRTGARYIAGKISPPCTQAASRAPNHLYLDTAPRCTIHQELASRGSIATPKMPENMNLKTLQQQKRVLSHRLGDLLGNHPY